MSQKTGKTDSKVNNSSKADANESRFFQPEDPLCAKAQHLASKFEYCHPQLTDASNGELRRYGKCLNIIAQTIGSQNPSVRAENAQFSCLLDSCSKSIRAEAEERDAMLAWIRRVKTEVPDLTDY